MFENFSRRHRLDHFESVLKYEHIPPEFRYDLFKSVRERCSKESSTLQEYGLYRGASISINADYFRLFSVDDIQEYYSPDLFVDVLQKAKWHEVLSIVEFLINEGPLSGKELNQLFDYHNVGYEAEKGPLGVATVVVKYSALIADNDHVIASDIPYKPVIEAITVARTALIDPMKIDVASSVGSSVLAVEAYLRGWLTSKGLSPTTLGDAIKLVKKCHCVHRTSRSLSSSSISIAIEQKTWDTARRTLLTSLARTRCCTMKWPYRLLAIFTEKAQLARGRKQRLSSIFDRYRSILTWPSLASSRTVMLLGSESSPNLMPGSSRGTRCVHHADLPWT